jgi:hypothetical protein
MHNYIQKDSSLRSECRPVIDKGGGWWRRHQPPPFKTLRKHFDQREKTHWLYRTTIINN